MFQSLMLRILVILAAKDDLSHYILCCFHEIIHI
ncbi:hypothetical protein Goarm_000962 [Gossypium armourianum]|uniref:Uncharacterized protein n=1 Tax=Gossypium armourianum TaxID=34283 RepID=A0A7J9KBH2_9ROSI|nr:hypothetical protein [Gossypium armourianum]